MGELTDRFDEEAHLVWESHQAVFKQLQSDTPQIGLTTKEALDYFLGILLFHQEWLLRVVERIDALDG